MGSRFLRTQIVSEMGLAAAAGTEDLIDLPVNPLSFLIFHVAALNNTATITNYSVIDDFLEKFSNIEVLHRGSQIIQGSGRDLAVMAALLTGYAPHQQRQRETDNDRRTMSFIVPFSRVPYWQKEAFPATVRGELQLRITRAADPSGLDGFDLTLEAVELLDAKPEQFLRYTTFTITKSVTGDQDADLPLGNPIAGILLFGTTVAAIDRTTDTLRTVRVKVDNVDMFYAPAAVRALHDAMAQRIHNPNGLQGHIHSVNAAGVGREDTLQEQNVLETLDTYAYLDFDPLKDDSYFLETAGRGRVHLRINYGATNAARMLPVEVVKLGAMRI